MREISKRKRLLKIYIRFPHRTGKFVKFETWIFSYSIKHVLFQYYIESLFIVCSNFEIESVVCVYMWNLGVLVVYENERNVHSFIKFPFLSFILREAQLPYQLASEDFLWKPPCRATDKRVTAGCRQMFFSTEYFSDLFDLLNEYISYFLF